MKRSTLTAMALAIGTLTFGMATAQAGSLLSPGVSKGESECKPEWTNCVCLHKPLGGKTCWNDVKTNGNSGGSSQRGRTQSFSLNN